LYIVAPEHGGAKLTFKIAGTNAAALYFYYHIFRPALGHGPIGFQPVVVRGARY
jgi:hypothetical protein